MYPIICLPGPDDVPQLDPGGNSLRGRVRADQAAGAGEVPASQERGDLHPADWARQLQVSTGNTWGLLNTDAKYLHIAL